MLAGVSVDYYVRMERGSLAGASESVLDAIAWALQLDEAERDHLYALARESGTGPRRRKRKTPATVRPALQQVLDAITDAPTAAGEHHAVRLLESRGGRAVLRRLRPDHQGCGCDAASRGGA